MKQNNSPWLTQLHHARSTTPLQKDITTDVVIVGGGIAGITTLFFLLKYTNKKIVLIEASKIAHGATGHNAGQVVAEFEKPLSEIIHEHGMKKTMNGLLAVEAAWDLTAEIFEDTKIDVPFKEVIGYGGYALKEQLLDELETEYIKSSHGMITFPVMISKESQWIKQIPEKYKSMCVEVDQVVIDQLLEASEGNYGGMLAHKAAVMNSALFTERLAEWCLENNKERCSIFENTSVHGIELALKQPKVITNDAVVVADQIILCTNGFENFYIHDKESLDIDTKFHHELHGRVGYMTGYTSMKPFETIANYYYPKEIVHSDDPYYYVTRRAFTEGDKDTTLMIVGGPEIKLQNREIYYREFDVAEQYHDDAVNFVENNFDMDGIIEKFFWHGLMGYTTSGVRLVGPEPLDPRLMYNLGCNGIGILPSIMGARKIADHINGEHGEATIFDPKR